MEGIFLIIIAVLIIVISVLLLGKFQKTVIVEEDIHLHNIINNLQEQKEILKKELEEFKDKNSSYRDKCTKLDAIVQNQELQLKLFKKNISEKVSSFEEIINNKNPFDYVAHLRAHALEHLAGNFNVNAEALAELYKYQYKFEYLLSIYPELQVYKDDNAYIKYKEEEEKRCNIKNWLADEEYEKLTVVKREQLAVDRYVSSSSKWTDWEKGRNYEIYSAYILYNEGFDIIQEGLNKKLEDKGRDIIAVHRDTGKILIVQCKNWVGHVRENIVFQLFGSYAQWLVDNNRKLWDDNVEAWLYVTGPVSDEAKKCAENLKVQIRHLPMGKFPAIKCNINNSSKEHIYHLPFDRHYDLVKINAKGKGYKFSIAEAIKEGFRRAYNH